MPIVAVFQSPSLTREKYEQTVRKLTGGKKSRLESAADWPVEGILVHAAGQTEKGFRASTSGSPRMRFVPDSRLRVRVRKQAEMRRLGPCENGEAGS